MWLSIWQRLRDRLRPRRDRFNLTVEPHYEIKASVRNPYFQRLERKAREVGCLGEFVVDEQGRLRPGTRQTLLTKKALLTLDVYPNPAAIEGRTIADYATPQGDPAQPSARRRPRLALVLEDDSQLFLRLTPDGVRLDEPAPRFRR